MKLSNIWCSWPFWSTHPGPRLPFYLVLLIYGDLAALRSRKLPFGYLWLEWRTLSPPPPESGVPWGSAESTWPLQNDSRMLHIFKQYLYKVSSSDFLLLRGFHHRWSFRWRRSKTDPKTFLGDPVQRTSIHLNFLLHLYSFLLSRNYLIKCISSCLNEV